MLTYFYPFFVWNSNGFFRNFDNCQFLFLYFQSTELSLCSYVVLA